MSKRSSKNFAPDPVEMLAVYLPDPSGHSTRCIGHLLLRGKMGVEAFDTDTKSIGLYPNQRAAADALSEATS